jgi:glycosyltransferase involved in cell wall biosynthesis
VNHVTGDVHFLTLLMRRRATVLTVLDLVTVERLHGLRRWLFRLLWFRLPIARTQVITVISSVTRDHLLRELGPLRQEVRVIHCPLMDGYLPIRRPFNTERPVVLVVGVKLNKNFERTVAALSAVPCKLRVIGVMSPEQKRLLDQSGLPYTAASGLSDEAVRQEYVNCDMLVFASTAEGFGLPILEAQATGRPVMTSNISSMPEVAGDAAEFVNPFDVESIRAGVQRVINDAAYREELIRRGFENVKRFSPQAIADQYAALYREVAALNRRPRTRV